MEPLQILMALVVFCLMLGLGSTVSKEDFVEVFRNPKAPLIGMFCQFGLMPFFAWAIAKALGVSDNVGLETLSCCNCDHPPRRFWSSKPNVGKSD